MSDSYPPLYQHIFSIEDCDHSQSVEAEKCKEKVGILNVYATKESPRIARCWYW